jgi:hypothetical protein
VDHIWKLHAISDEKDGNIVADHVEIAFPGVEFDCKSTRITESFRGSTFVDYGGETDDNRGLDTGRAEEISTGEMGDVVGDFKEAFGGSATGVDDTFRDTLTVKLHVE